MDNDVQGGFNLAYTTNDGTATTADGDYVDNDSSLAFTGTASETQDIEVTIVGDDNVEDNETFTITLGDVTATTAEQDGDISTGASATGTINNDDSATVTIENESITEGDVDQTLTFTVTLDAEVEGGFDMAILDDVLFGAERPTEAIAEAVRILRPGGRLLLLAATVPQEERLAVRGW